MSKSKLLCQRLWKLPAGVQDDPMNRRGACLPRPHGVPPHLRPLGVIPLTLRDYSFISESYLWISLQWTLAILFIPYKNSIEIELIPLDGFSYTITSMEYIYYLNFYYPSTCLTSTNWNQLSTATITWYRKYTYKICISEFGRGTARLHIGQYFIQDLPKTELFVHSLTCVAENAVLAQHDPVQASQYL